MAPTPGWASRLGAGSATNCSSSARWSAASAWRVRIRRATCRRTLFVTLVSMSPAAETSCYQVLTSESNQAFANWVRGTHHQGIELVHGLAVGADRTLSGTEQNSNRLSVAPLPWNRVVLPSEGFASHLDGVQLV